METISTVSPEHFHIFNISLIYGKNLASPRTAGAVYQAPTVFHQCWTGKQQVTAGAALTAVAFPAKNLALNIGFFKMNKEKAPRLSCHINRKTEISACLQAKRNPPVVKASKRFEAADDFTY